MENSAATARAPEEIVNCAQCHTMLSGTQDREITPQGVLCRPCYNNRRSDLERVIQEQGRDVNYPMALVGALAGGAAGALAWWGITVVSQVAFGAVAILIGIAVAKGATLMSGNKRSRGLQILSVSVAALSFLYASYLVNRTFIQQVLAKEGKEAALSLLPDPALLFRVVSLNFDAMSFLFLGIVLWEAWKLTAPARVR
jgi:hypothetical protein